MKKSNWAFIPLALVVAILIASCGNSAQSQQNSELDVFAKCLTSSGAKMYGAYWCPHCQNQKTMFGASWQHIDYVECSLPNRAGQTQECSDAGVRAYPTWEFKGGEREEGGMTFAQLGEKTGCRLN